MAIRFLLGNMFKIGTLQGERIAAPVCALARNDREIGAWFLKLMTLPPRGKAFRVLRETILFARVELSEKNVFTDCNFPRIGI